MAFNDHKRLILQPTKPVALEPVKPLMRQLQGLPLGVILSLCAVVPGYAGTFRKLTSMPNFLGVTGPLTADAQGNLFVTAGGNGGTGAIYLLKAPSGYTAKRLLYSFPPNTGYPYVAPYPAGGVTLDHGQIFGTAITPYDGTNGGIIYDVGSVTAISYLALHTFTDDGFSDGWEPMSGLTPGPSHQLVGTTAATGNYFGGGGVAFTISDNPTSPNYQIIHYFGTSPDGDIPTSGRLVADKSGTLYGATAFGGIHGAGTIFEIAEVGSSWNETVILSTNNIVGQLSPTSGTNVVADGDGNLFACLKGGIYGYGGVIELAHPKHGSAQWNEEILVQFGAHAYDPMVSQACGITFNPITGGLTGVTDEGGLYNFGTLMTITPPALSGKAWGYKVDHDFAGTGRDGINPSFPPTLVGNTYYGSSRYLNSIDSLVWSYMP